MVLDDAFPPDLRVEREAAALMEAGHQVTLICLHPDAVGSNSFEHNDLAVISVAMGPFWRKMSALAYTVPLYHWKVSRVLKAILKGEEVDVMHVHDLKVARGAWWGRPKGAKWLLDLHENRPEIMRHYRHVKSGLGKLLIHPRIWTRFERRYMELADAVVLVTEEAGDWYRARGWSAEAPLIVVPNYSPRGFNPDPQEKILGLERPRLLYIGDTGERRGLGTAIAAIDLLRPVMEVELHVLGTGSFQTFHERDIRERGLEDLVRLHGWVPPSEFGLHLREAHIGICPLHRNPHHDTTYANKIFQYMSFGLPILVSDCPAQAQVVAQGQCGRVHRAEDVEDFAEQLRDMVSDRDRYSQWSIHALAVVDRTCNWEVAATGFVAGYPSA